MQKPKMNLKTYLFRTYLTRKIHTYELIGCHVRTSKNNCFKQYATMLSMLVIYERRKILSTFASPVVRALEKHALG